MVVASFKTMEVVDLLDANHRFAGHMGLQSRNMVVTRFAFQGYLLKVTPEMVASSALVAFLNQVAYFDKNLVEEDTSIHHAYKAANFVASSQEG